MNRLLYIFCLALLVPATLLSQTTWKAPGYKPDSIRKVMVLAKVIDDAARRQLEDFTVKFLNDKGIRAVTAYTDLKRTKFASREAFLAYADSIGVDALLVFNVDDAQKIAENKPTISVGVGVGMYGGYMGASAPIAGGPKVVTLVNMSGKYFTRNTSGEQWIIKLSGKLDGPTDKLAYTVAKNTVKAMISDGLFIKK